MVTDLENANKTEVAFSFINAILTGMDRAKHAERSRDIGLSLISSYLLKIIFMQEASCFFMQYFYFVEFFPKKF
jgi:hypothetical protein